jgi:hypothetical protein
MTKDKNFHFNKPQKLIYLEKGYPFIHYNSIALKDSLVFHSCLFKIKITDKSFECLLNKAL